MTQPSVFLLQLTERADFHSMDKFVQLLIEYVPSLTISFLNFLVPFIFAKVVKGEDYSPELEIQWTLGRWVTEGR